MAAALASFKREGAIRVVSMPPFLATLAHRAGGIDDEPRCGLRVAGMSRGGRVHLHFQLDPVLVGVAGRHSGLADGINALGQRRRVGVWA